MYCRSWYFFTAVAVDDVVEEEKEEEEKDLAWRKKDGLELVGVVERGLPLLLLLMSEAVLDIVDYIFNLNKPLPPAYVTDVPNILPNPATAR